MPLLASSVFVAFDRVAQCRLAARFARKRHLATRIMVIALAVAAVSPVWSSEPANHPHGKATAAANASTDLSTDRKVPDAIAKAGAKTRVAIAWDCELPNQAPVVWARADHGTISVNDVTEPHCGRSSMHLAGIFYTSEPGFKGTDKLYVLGFLASGKIDQTYTVLVR